MGDRTYNKFMAEIQDTLCNGMMNEDELREEVLRLHEIIEALEAKLAALVEIGEVRLKHLELLKKRGLNEPESSEYDVLKAAIAAAKEE